MATSILNKLDDVSLKKVFQFLHLRDLSNTAETCKRFKHNADEVFKSTYSKLDLLQLIEGDKVYHEEWFMVRWLAEKFLNSVEQLLRNFGPYINALSLTGIGEKDGMEENQLLTMVKTYCPSLKELILDNVGKDDFHIELRALFAGLEKLSIFRDFGSDVNDSFVSLLSECHDLKHLNVGGVSATMWIKHKFPKLETLKISSYWEFDYSDFESFLSSHENIRSLTYDDTDIPSIYFPIISKGSPKLETFCCIAEICGYDDDEEVEENILQLSKLKLLRNFTFTCEESSLKLLIDAFEKENTPLEHFEILDCRIDSEIIDGVLKLRSLKTLKLTRCVMVEETFFKLTKHLNRLDEVIITDLKEFNLNDHSDKVQLPDNVSIFNSTKKVIRKRPGSDQSSSEFLSILNDDCLIQIFEFLPLPDLCNVADVCKRFQKNAQTIFQLYHTSFKTSEITGHSGFVYTDLQVTEQLFRNFGFFIRELSLKGGWSRNDIEQETILYLATKYCSSLSLHTLTLDQMNLGGPMRWIFPLLDLFHRLQKLELHLCRLDGNFGKFLSFCQIPMIQVFSPKGSMDWMNYTFWHLQTLLLMEIWHPESALREFIKLNGHLKVFAIHQSSISSKIFKTVADHMPELQGFSFAGKNPKDRKTRKNILNLARLKYLTDLSLNCGLVSLKRLIDKFVSEMIPIAELNINYGSIDMELIDKLVNLNYLKSLQLRRVNMKKLSLIDLVKKLPDLEELDIDIKGIVVSDVIKLLQIAKNLTTLKIGSERSQVQINIVDYQSILEIVKKREKFTKLHITIVSDKRQVLVPHYMLQGSSYWLKIENEIIENLRLVMSDSDSDTDLGDSESSASSVEESDDNIDMEE